MSEVLDYIYSLFLRIKTLIGIMFHAFDDLEEFKFPSELVNLASLKETIEEYLRPENNVFNVDTFYAWMLQTHLTFVMNENCPEGKEPNSMQCPFTIVTFIPIVEREDYFTVIDVELVPTYHIGYVTNDWKILNLPEKQLLGRNKQLFPHDPRHTHCIDDSSEIVCNMCLRQVAEQRHLSDCLRKLVSGDNPWKVCGATKVDASDYFYRLDALSWAYTDMNPGTITEQCPGKAQETRDLMHAGILQLNETCSYTMANGPFRDGDITRLGNDIPISINDEYLMVPNPYPSETDEDEEDSVIKGFVKTHPYELFFGLIGGLVLMLLGSGLCIWIYRRQPRVRTRFRTRRRRREPSPEIQELEERENIVMRALVPSLFRALPPTTL